MGHGKKIPKIQYQVFLLHSFFFHLYIYCVFILFLHKHQYIVQIKQNDERIYKYMEKCKLLATNGCYIPIKNSTKSLKF